VYLTARMRFPAAPRNPSLHLRVETGAGIKPFSYVRDTSDSQGVTRSERKADRLPTLTFAAVIILQSKVVSLVSNPQPGGPGPCICGPQ
jgi:hypothetical protein